MYGATEPTPAMTIVEAARLEADKLRAQAAERAAEFYDRADRLHAEADQCAEAGHVWREIAGAGQ